MPPRRSHEALIITKVTIIDTVRGGRHPDMDVVVLGHRIQAVGRTTEVARPATAMTIDGSGAYLIPGLWDMHVHVCAYRNTACGICMCMYAPIGTQRRCSSPMASQASGKWRATAGIRVPGR